VLFFLLFFPYKVWKGLIILLRIIKINLSNVVTENVQARRVVSSTWQHRRSVG